MSPYSRLAAAAALGCFSAGCVAVDRTALRREADVRAPNSTALTTALDHRDATLRAEAAAAMGRTGSRLYAPALRQALRDTSATVRFEAVFALGQLWIEQDAPAPVEVVNDVLPAIVDPEPRVRAAAVEALGKLGPPDLEPRLLTLLSDQEAQVRREAATALFRMRYLKRLTAYSTTTVRALADATNDPDADVRWRAAYAFSRWPEKDAAETLAKAAEDEAALVRLFALRGLAQLKEKGPAEPAVVGLDDPDERVRAEAIATLKAQDRSGKLGKKVLRDPSPHVRAAAADALDNTGGSLAILDELARDKSSFVRGAAVAAFAKRLGDKADVRLAELLQDKDPLIRAKACAATIHLPTAGRKLAEDCLKDGDVRVRAAALEALAERPGNEVDILLSVALSDPDSPIELRGTAMDAVSKRKAAELVPALIKAYDRSLGRDWVEVRESAVASAEALAKEHPKDEKLAEFRKRLLKDPAYSVRLKAAKSLGVEPPPAELESASPFLDREVPARPLVSLETDKGVVLIELAREHAPVHTASFLELVNRGFYDGLSFHRVVTNFVVQGGDPRGTGWGDPGYSLKDEINPLKFLRGTVGMAKAGRDTGGCQLFITLVPTPHLDGRYTSFGRVVAGLDVVDKLVPGDVIRRAQLR